MHDGGSFVTFVLRLHTANCVGHVIFSFSNIPLIEHVGGTSG